MSKSERAARSECSSATEKRSDDVEGSATHREIRWTGLAPAAQ